MNVITNELAVEQELEAGDTLTVTVKVPKDFDKDSEVDAKVEVKQDAPFDA